MPCMGPNFDLAEHQGEEAFEMIMEILETKYGIKNWGPAPIKKDAEKSFMHNHWKKNSEEWDEKAEELKKAIVDLIWHQHCMDF